MAKFSTMSLAELTRPEGYDCACGKHHADADGDHTSAACGIEDHYNCDGKDHSAAPCGKHFACAEGYEASQHAQCAVCGGYLCDGGDHQHDAPGATEIPATQPPATEPPAVEEAPEAA